MSKRTCPYFNGVNNWEDDRDASGFRFFQQFVIENNYSTKLDCEDIHLERYKDIEIHSSGQAWTGGVGPALEYV